MADGIPAGSSTRGVFIVVEGLDRAGKSSQCELLRRHLEGLGFAVTYIRFPDRTTAIGQLIDSYLRGDSLLDDHSIHLLFAANRWEWATRIEKDIAEGVTVIVDRYSYSGCVYSAAKDRPDLTLEWAWLPEIGLPRPDLCLFLQLSPEEASKRGGFGLERYENSKMQSRVRECFQRLFQMLQGDEIRIIDAGAAVHEVSREIQGVVQSCMDSLHAIGPMKKFGALPA